MPSKETQELILEAIKYYITNGLCPNDSVNVKDIDIMKKIIKFDEIKKSLGGEDEA